MGVCMVIYLGGFAEVHEGTVGHMVVVSWLLTRGTWWRYL